MEKLAECQEAIGECENRTEKKEKSVAVEGSPSTDPGREVEFHGSREVSWGHEEPCHQKPEVGSWPHSIP